jgi:hypothetical protein
MKLNRCLLVAVALCVSVLHAQDRVQVQAPKTQIEAFDAQAGTVMIRGFSKVGEMKGVYGGILTVQSIEFTDATTGKKEYGISIDVKETDRLERTNRSFIDFDEIPSFLKGIDYISKVDSSVTKLDNFQADFRTKGDFKISTFSSAKETMASISSGSIGETSMFLKIGDVARFRDFIASAKNTLDSLRAGK